MSNAKIKLVSVFFTLSSTLKRKLGRDMSPKVVVKTKCHYKELNPVYEFFKDRSNGLRCGT
jgi:hypothetical protein